MFKKTFAAMWLTGAIGMVGIANANNLPDYGCTVFMCLANPKGPTDAPYCRPYIDQLYTDLSHGPGLPACEEAGHYAKQVFDPYDPCPDSLKAAVKQSYVVEGVRLSGGRRGFFDDGVFDTVGKPKASEPQFGLGKFGERACVGKKAGVYQIGSNNNGYMVNVYDKVLWQQPQSPNAIDVYINGQFSNRVRW